MFSANDLIVVEMSVLIIYDKNFEPTFFFVLTHNTTN